MKYSISTEIIPQEKRKELNEKILYIVDNKLSEKYGITQNDVFSSYTGDGGLHGLNFKDYNSFYAYTEAKKEIENGQFYTPHNICKFIMDCIKPNNTDIICDMTAGMGNFANYVTYENNFYLNEIDIKSIKIMKYLYPNAPISNEDIRYFKPKMQFDIIVGNPPYNLKWQVEKEQYLSQYYYCIKANELLKAGGLFVLLIPNSFMSDEFSNKYQIDYMNNNFNFVCQFDLPSNAFKNVGVENFETKIIIFQKRSEFIECNKYSFDKININGTNEFNSNYIYEKYIKDLQHQKETLKAKLFYENIHQKIDTDKDKDFIFKVQKMLFDIKRCPKIAQYYSEALEYYNSLYNQKKPENLNNKEWYEIMITKDKVIKKLKHILKKQTIIERDEIKLVKTNYSLKLKAYSDEMQKIVDKMNNSNISINDLVLNGNYKTRFSDNTYKKLINRKVNQYQQQNRDFSLVQENLKIKEWLTKTYLYDNENEEKIYLNDKQLLDTNKALQKKYSYLQWEQGSGKSITGIFQALCRLEHNNIKNVFIVAPAIAIKNTWSTMLDNFKIDCCVLNKIEDIKNIKEGQFILLTFGMVCKLQTFIKKYIKQNNKKFMFILDEADGLTNVKSQRTKACKNCFRKLPYKLFLSGTSTRNSINESFSQFELLYNNSINMLCECENLYTYDKENDDMHEESNPYYLKPYPPYVKGYEVFSQCHVPVKASVFGVSKYNQDIYNKELLRQLINKTIITRRLEEIAGRKLYNINQQLCKFTETEKELYMMILDEFYSMSSEYHIHTGNSRKDSMFRILAQLNTLLKACSVPHTFREYKGDTTSSKILKVFKLLDKFDNERVAIGCIRIKTVNIYANLIKQRYPDRKLFIITGQSTTLKQRREIIKQLKEYPNAILLSTQASLSCSMNIGFIDKVIIPEMAYNDSAIGQYRGRFIRMNSENLTEVFNIVYDKSIEINLLKLIMCKETLNLFMKNEEVDNEELFEKYGISSYIFSCLMVKEKDENGVRITWGEQNII